MVLAECAALNCAKPVKQQVVASFSGSSLNAKWVFVTSTRRFGDICSRREEDKEKEKDKGQLLCLGFQWINDAIRPGPRRRRPASLR